MAKEKVNYQEVYDLYQLCSETKDLREFCADYGVNYDKFMNWQRHQLWSEKLGKTVQVEQPKVAKVRITGKPCNSPTVKLEVKQPEKIGFIHALKTSELEAKDMSKTSSVTFNCYFQK